MGASVTSTPEQQAAQYTNTVRYETCDSRFPRGVRNYWVFGAYIA